MYLLRRKIGAWIERKRRGKNADKAADRKVKKSLQADKDKYNISTPGTADYEGVTKKSDKKEMEDRVKKLGYDLYKAASKNKKSNWTIYGASFYRET